jgi:hypothetical protein
MVILYGAGMSNSSGHVGDNLPIALFGGGSGTLQGGQHLHYENRPTMADLCVTLLEKSGLPVERFGISTGELPLEPITATLSGV